MSGVGEHGPPYEHRFGRPSWECQNTPPCPHPAYVHDVEDYEDQQPTCCADGCTCGHGTPPARTAGLVPYTVWIDPPKEPQP